MITLFPSAEPVQPTQVKGPCTWYVSPDFVTMPFRVLGQIKRLPREEGQETDSYTLMSLFPNASPRPNAGDVWLQGFNHELYKIAWSNFADMKIHTVENQDVLPRVTLF